MVGIIDGRILESLRYDGSPVWLHYFMVVFASSHRVFAIFDR
jgi:hypothetical protein